MNKDKEIEKMIANSTEIVDVVCCFCEQEHGVNSVNSRKLKDAILYHFQDEQIKMLEELIKGYYCCDNANCGNGAICNYCALSKDIKQKIEYFKKED